MRSMRGWPGTSRTSRSNVSRTTPSCTAPASNTLSRCAQRSKTRIVYCQDANRRDAAEHTSFTFLGYTFRARRARNKNGVVFTSFLPAVSKDALKKMGQEVRRWRVHRRTDLDFAGLARMINP